VACDGEVGLEHLVVEVTEDCNNACLHCYNYWAGRRRPARGRHELARSRIREIVREAGRDAPIAQIGLSGGEPMLRDDLPEIVGDLLDEGLNPIVITNGTLLTEERLARFPRGTIFEVTLFSVRRETHDRLAGNVVFDDIVEGLVRAERHGCRFAMACVITKLNAHDVGDTIELGIALGADAVLINRVNLSRSVLPLADQLVPSVPMLRESLDAAEETADKYDTSIAVSVPIPACLIDPSGYSRLHFGWCPRGGKESYYTVSCDGTLRPCNHSSVILGDLSEQSLSEIITNERTRDFWRPVPQECLQCTHPLRDQCRGGCPAAADECYGSRSRVDPFVEYARRAEGRR
jgi:pyrroloquinoline quinone biosynthesis protein E